MEAAGYVIGWGTRWAFGCALPRPHTAQRRPHADFTTGTSTPDGPLPEPMSAPRGEGWPGVALTGVEPPSTLGITAGA